MASASNATRVEQCHGCQFAREDREREELGWLEVAHRGGLFIGVGTTLKNGSKSVTGWKGISRDSKWGYGIFVGGMRVTGEDGRQPTLIEAVKSLLRHSGEDGGGGSGGGGSEARADNGGTNGGRGGSAGGSGRAGGGQSAAMADGGAWTERGKKRGNDVLPSQAHEIEKARTNRAKKDAAGCSGGDSPANASWALSMNRQLSYAIYTGAKSVENTTITLKPGWYALHTGNAQEIIASHLPLLANICDLPDESNLPHSAIVAVIRVLQTMDSKDAKPFSPWVDTRFTNANVIDGAVRLNNPVHCSDKVSLHASFLASPTKRPSYCGLMFDLR